MSGVADVVFAFYGVPIHGKVQENLVTVGTATVQVAPTNAKRIKIELFNYGATNIVISRSNDVAATGGFTMAKDTSYKLDFETELDSIAEWFWATGDAAGGLLYVREVILLTPGG